MNYSRQSSPCGTSSGDKMPILKVSNCLSDLNLLYWALLDLNQ
jgi:hypothetical protein